MSLTIKRDNLDGPEVISLLQEHLTDMYATSPPESVHALDVQSLKSSNIQFFSAWEGTRLAGCAAINVLNESETELKSMRTAKPFRNKGVASELLRFIIQHAKQKNYKTLNLETGTQDYFLGARALYLGFGFQYCEPFGQYKKDPNSCFMTFQLD